MDPKWENSLRIIENAVDEYWPKIAVACSFGKDSMVVVHLAKKVRKDIPVFSVMTPYKPRETFEYLVKMDREMNLNTTVYIVSKNIPEPLKNAGIKVVLLSPEKFEKAAQDVEKRTGMKIYHADPDLCCNLLKVEPTKVAVKDLDAWITGLRNTEGETRKDYQTIENRYGLIKINPILSWTEADVWRYMAAHSIPVHPWYTMGYRSLGCEPCTHPGGERERDGRWRGTPKQGGECGIHTQNLRAPTDTTIVQLVRTKQG